MNILLVVWDPRVFHATVEIGFHCPIKKNLHEHPSRGKMFLSQAVGRRRCSFLFKNVWASKLPKLDEKAEFFSGVFKSGLFGF